MPAFFKNSPETKNGLTAAQELDMINHVNAPVLGLVKNLNKIDRFAESLDIFNNLKAFDCPPPAPPADLDIEAPFRQYEQDNAGGKLKKKIEFADHQSKINYYDGKRLVGSLTGQLNLKLRVMYTLDTLDKRSRRDIFDHDRHWKSTIYFTDNKFGLIKCRLSADSNDGLKLKHHQDNVDGSITRRFNRLGNCLTVMVRYPSMENLYFPVIADYVSSVHPEVHPKITFEHQSDGSILGEYRGGGGQLIASVALDSEFKITRKQIYNSESGSR